ncbi:MAG: hypothetical protein JNM41_11215 [Flavipsychrobacter sp.]|nr:hypothetical protein [Flavipsychrobacter sp.]
MNLFVANLHPDTTAEALRVLFSEFGEIVSYKVIFDPGTGASRGFGFVEMADKMKGFDAIDNLDQTFFEGNIISVKEAKQNNQKGGGGGRSFNKPRGPRPGGYNREGGGGYNREGGGGGFNRDRGGYNREGGSGGFNRDRGGYNRDSGGGYNRDNSGGYNRDNSGGYNRDTNYNRDQRDGGYNRDRNYKKDEDFNKL